MSNRIPARRCFRHACALGSVAILAALAGCSTLLAAREQQNLAARIAVVSGTVGADHEVKGPLIVGIVARGDQDFYLIDHFVTEEPGPFVFAVAAGRYWLVALEDANGDGRYDSEPALPVDPAKYLDLAPGQRIDNVVLTVPLAGRLPRASFAFSDVLDHSPAAQPDEHRVVSVFALSVDGAIASLDDPRFDESVADAGMWKFYDFFLNSKPGIYFLHEYDPDKIPVLFVHGMRGTPRSFAPLVDALDSERYQPWFFYYPTGARLDTVAQLLRQLFLRLRLAYGFERFAVVAHSMGGLVTRAFLLDYFETSRGADQCIYVTISSPLGGMASAGKGVERSPVVLYPWHGLAPGSEFLDGLYWVDPAQKTQRRRLPSSVTYHMMFGFQGGGLSGSSDGIVTLTSQLRPEAQEEAQSLRGFDATHVGILREPSLARRLAEVLSPLQ